VNAREKGRTDEFSLRCPDGQTWPAATYADAVIAQTVTDCGALCSRCGQRGHVVVNPEKADRAVRCKAVRGGRQCVLNVDHQPRHVWERFDGDPPPENADHIEPCDWCGRAIKRDARGWYAVKGWERGYPPYECDTSFDGKHEPREYVEALSRALLHNEHATRPNQHDEAVAAGEIDCPRQPDQETDHD
jgi:hypothetical protein